MTRGNSLRLTVWNCAGWFEKKHQVLDQARPDIAIIPEASAIFARGLPPHSSSLWIGAAAGRGVGVLALNGWTLERADVEVDERFFLPCIATKGLQRLQVIGVCVNKTSGYVTPTLTALAKLSTFLASGPTILAGDFNQSAAFAKPHKRHFQRVLDRLVDLGMTSAWHRFHGEAFGRETAPTYYMHWRNDPTKQFHIDYALVSPHFVIEAVSIGSYADYPGRRLSDHVALSVDLSLPD